MNDFLSEIKRRRVVRVLVVYGATAFAVLQVADLAFPRLGLPDWTVTLVLMLGLLGAPVAVALAWAFDLTSEGLKRTGPAPDLTGEAAPRPAWLSAGTVVAVVVALVAASAAGWMAGRGSGAADAAGAGEAPRDRSSIAVLPFANMGGRAEDEYFSDGLAEELLNLLARVEGLKVAARTSAFAFRGRAADVRAIGDSLDVATVLEGSVRRDGERLRVTAQLIDVADGYHLWSESYDTELAGVFEVQERIARSIVDALQVQLGAAGTFERGAAPSLEAHDIYLLGLSHFNERRILEAIEAFQRAADADPGYAEAWAWLALSHAVSSPFGGAQVDSAAALTREAAERAIALGDRLAEPWAALCQVATYIDHDWDEAERVCDSAVRRNPNSAIAHQWRAEMLMIRRRFAEADSAIGRALSLDPRALVAPLIWMLIPYTAGDLGETERRAAAVEVSDATGNARWLLASVAVLRGDTAALRPLASLFGSGRADLPELLVRARGDAAARSEALALLDSSGPPDAPQPTAHDLAQGRALFGDYPAALLLLEEALERREFNLALALGLPVFDPLHEDPRFLAVVRGLDLEPWW